MREQWITGTSGIQKETTPKLAAAAGVNQIWVEPIKELRADGRVGAPETKATYRDFLEEIVTQKQLIGALASEDDFYSGALGQARKVEHRRRAGADKWGFGVPYDVRETLRDGIRTH